MLAFSYYRTIIRLTLSTVKPYISGVFDKKLGTRVTVKG